MNLLNKEQTQFIRSEVKRRGIKLPDLEEDLVDFICTAVENELQYEPDFNIAFQKVVDTIKPNELKMAQERTEELLSNKVSLLQKIVFSALSLLGMGFVLLMFAIPFASSIILVSTLTLLILYLYSNIRWYISFNDYSIRQKLVLSAGLSVVCLLLLAFIFKLNHYSGAGIMLVSSLGILIFLPIIFNIYFFIKKGNTQLTFILPIIARNRFKIELVLLIMLLLGFIARFLLLNTLGNMLIIVSLFCLGIIFTSYTWQFYVAANKKIDQVLLLITSTICYIIFLTVALFKIMNWPLPFGGWNDISFVLLGLLAVVWYGRGLIYQKSRKYVLLFFFSCLLSAYALLLFMHMSQQEAVAKIIYNIPVLLLFTSLVFAFYKHTLFRALSVFLLAYYLLAFPYLLMPNKKIIEWVYQYDPEFVALYTRTYNEPDASGSWKELLEYEHKARTLSSKK
jgi:hypothetical protein